MFKTPVLRLLRKNEVGGSFGPRREFTVSKRVRKTTASLIFKTPAVSEISISPEGERLEVRAKKFRASIQFCGFAAKAL